MTVKAATPSLSDMAKQALAYYEHEALRPYYWGGNVKPLGGLPLGKFRAARDELRRKGMIVQHDGRWILAEHVCPDTAAAA